MKKIATAGILLLLATSAVGADQIVMSNGDRYSGRVTTMTGGTLQMETEFGKLRLPWTRIVGLETDQPVELTLTSGNRLTGVIVARDGIIRFADPELAGLSLPLQEIDALASADAPDLRVEGMINFGAAATRGNTETESYHASGEFIARTARNRFRIDARLNYGKEEGQLTESDVSAATGYDHFFRERWYFTSNVGLARDEFKDLDLRTTVGAGLGYQFRDLPSDRLSIELGLSYIHEDFDQADDQSQPAGRYALNVLRELPLGPTLFHRHEVLFGLEQMDDVLLQTQTGLRFPVAEQLTGTIQIDFDYDWQPSPAAEPEDISYLVTLGYQF